MMSRKGNEFMNMPAGAQRVIELAEQVLTETASDQEIAELESMMVDQPELRRIYLRYALVHGQLALTTVGLPEVGMQPFSLNGSLVPLKAVHSPAQGSWLFVVTSVAAAVLLAVSAGIYFAGSTDNPGGVSSNQSELANNDVAAVDEVTGDVATGGHYDNRNLPVHVVGVLDTDRLRNISPTTFTVRQGATGLTTADGTNVQIEGPAMFGASSRSEGVLFEGSVHASLKRPDTNYSIQTSSLRVVDRGTGFRVATMEHDRIRVDVIDGEVEVQSRVRRPLYYWSFDDGGAEGSAESDAELSYIGDRVKYSPGLVGSGALAFDNRGDTFVRIETGMGVEVGTGEMACSSGISIEALVISRWSGQQMDYDEIFRKEDGNHRMLLSFQNDGDVNHFDVPEVAPGPCLSFGLHLEQHGYSELDMPLDGIEGRPSLQELTDGKPHHIVATYDSFTGRKAIYIDGRRRFSHDFPVGTLILSGGPSPATIGNHRNNEPFTGIIDEVAFYDFALLPNEIANHYEQAMRGQPYFAPQSGPIVSDRWLAIALVGAGTSQIFDTLTGRAIP